MNASHRAVSPAPLAPSTFPRIVRVRGWMLILIGPSLCVTMACFAFYLAQTIYGDSFHPSRPRWHGSHEMTALAFGISGAIFLFGLLSVVNGILLLRNGRLRLVAVVPTVLTILAIVGITYRIITAGAPL